MYTSTADCWLLTSRQQAPEGAGCQPWHSRQGRTEAEAQACFLDRNQIWGFFYPISLWAVETPVFMQERVSAQSMPGPEHCSVLPVMVLFKYEEIRLNAGLGGHLAETQPCFTNPSHQHSPSASRGWARSRGAAARGQIQMSTRSRNTTQTTCQWLWSRIM